MTPGRKYRPEDLLRITWRRKWLLIVPLLLGGIGTAIYANSLPNVYQSETVIQVIPQGIPESFVRSTVTTQLGQRLNTISQLILSRNRLENLILELKLYETERRNGTMQDAVERMQRDIRGPTLTTSQRTAAARQRSGTSGSFVLGFASGDPQTALRVTERLASMFIEENLRQRTGQAESTDKFLESQLENARLVLEQHEKRLAEFNRRYASTLPKQLSANASGLQSTQSQINNLVEKIVLDRERRLVLERQITDLEGLAIIEATARQAAARRPNPSAALGSSRSGQGSSGSSQRAGGNTQASTGNSRQGSTTRGGSGRSPSPQGSSDDRGRGNASLLLDGDANSDSAAARLERARAALQALEFRLTSEHPDVKIARRQITELEKLAEEEALQAPLSTQGPLAGLSPAEVQKQQQLKALREEMERLDRQIERKEAEEKLLRDKAAVYQTRIEETPSLEAQLTALTRDYDITQGQYDGLLKKKADAKIATELEHRQIAEQFRMVEPPRLPQRPSSPDRPRLILLGSFSGLALGLLLAGGLEYRDRSFKTDVDVVVALSLPVLAMVPTIVTRGDRKRLLRRRLVLTGSAVGIMMLSFAAWKFHMFNRWLS